MRDASSDANGGVVGGAGSAPPDERSALLDRSTRHATPPRRPDSWRPATPPPSSSSDPSRRSSPGGYGTIEGDEERGTGRHDDGPDVEEHDGDDDDDDDDERRDSSAEAAKKRHERSGLADDDDDDDDDKASTTAWRDVRAWARQNEGVMLIALAQLFYSCMSLFFKLLNEVKSDGPAIGALQVICVRMGITYVGCLSWMLLSRTPHPLLGPPEVRALLAVRGVCGFFGLFGLYFSLQYLSLSDATTITFLAPLFTGALGSVVLQEPFTRRELVAGAVSLAGVTLIARPTFLFGHPNGGAPDVGGGGRGHPGDYDMPGEAGVAAALAVVGAAAVESSARWTSWAATRVGGSALALDPPSLSLMATPTWRQWSAAVATAAASRGAGDDATEAQRVLAVCVALFGCVGAAGAYCSIRAIGRRATPTHSVAYFSLWSTLVSATAMAVRGDAWIWPSSWEWAALLVVLGLFGLAAQILAAMGLQREKAGRAAALVYTQALYSTLLQLVVLGEAPRLASACGCAVILAAAAWLTLGGEGGGRGRGGDGGGVTRARNARRRRARATTVTAAGRDVRGE